MFETNTSVELSNHTFGKFLSKVFLYVAFGVLISGIMGYAWLHVPAFRSFFASIVFSRFGMYIVLAVQIGLVFLLRSVMNKGNLFASFLVYIAYAITISLTFAIVGLLFRTTTIYKAFFTAVVLFGTMSFIGLTTKVDLTRFSNLFSIGLIVLIGTSVLNAIIFRATYMDLIISAVGLILFLGLTAFDIQKLRQIYLHYQHDESALKVYSVYGAFELYLDFINIFLSLVRLFGRND